MSDDDPFLASLSTTRPAQGRDGRNGGRQGGRNGDSYGRNGGGGGGGGPRVPPHNLPAEEAVLGAILLSREALGAVIEAGLRYDDFYKPAHQHIYDVAVSVSQSGGPADTITVADELQRLGLLDAVGGVETLHGLQNATPAISNAGHYAKIVADAAMLRRLIMVAGDISEIAYSGPDNVDQALDEAETKVFKVADRRVSDTYAEIGELMKGAIERIEENYARGDTITGIPSGYQDLDELLSGLQPSTLNIVGARPAMGKCILESTSIIDVETGELVTAGQLFDLAATRERLDVLSLDERGRLGRRAVSACLDDGVKPVFKVTTRSGRTVTITASHPLLTAGGWKPLADIVVGEAIAMPAALPVFGSDDLPDAEIDLMALLIGDGSISSGSPDLTTASPAVLEAHNKRLPSAVFRLPQLRLARFLNRLFATDGTAWVAASGYARIGYASVSEQLARDVQHLLTRFGIRTNLRQRSVKYRGDRRQAFEVEIMDAPSLLAFCDEIGIVGKEAAVERVRARAAAAQRQFSLDVVPAAVWDDVQKARERAGLSWAETSRRCGKPSSHNWHQGRRGPLRRETVAQLAEVFDDDQLRWWASPDVAWDRVVSIASAGEQRVIDFTVPETHNFVAADLYVHNTAFGLGMATNVAKVSGKPVLVFSLEMGHIELTQRILSSEAEVDSTKIRNGKLTENDWARIGRAIGRLEVPLYLDDNPRVTVMEIRAKARRLKMQKGDLGLILIDYLQLMSGGGNSENRQLEVSEISRNLKILARELEVPIVALSQLSRNLEARSDKKPMLSDLRESGCLTAATRLLRADTNTEITLGELVDTGALDVPVWSLDEHYRMVPATLTHAFPSGVKRVFRMRLASGRTIDATANHRFCTVDGWTSLDELHVGARLAVPRLLGSPEHVTPMSSGDIALHAVAEAVGRDVFALPTAQVAHYLRRRWDLARRAGGAVIEPGACISIRCSDASVADHLQQLLLRLAIRSTIHITGGHGEIDAERVTLRVRGVDGHRRFVADVLGGGVTVPDASSDDENETVPGSADGRRGEASRSRLAELADVLGDKDLADLAASDVVWDRIVAIDDIGVHEVFDATVLSTHNFIANGIVAHNSLEQDADVVMFLYRDEVYNKESPDRGAADLIVAKHRAGPIGDMRLVFRGQYARFDNAAPRSMG